MSDANLERANLIAAKLIEANLSNSNLSNSNLAYANLVGANLRNAQLDNATLPDGKKWGSGIDMERFTNPKHVNFWNPDDVRGMRYALRNYNR